MGSKKVKARSNSLGAKLMRKAGVGSPSDWGKRWGDAAADYLLSGEHAKPKKSGSKKMKAKK